MTETDLIAAGYNQRGDRSWERDVDGAVRYRINVRPSLREAYVQRLEGLRMSMQLEMTDDWTVAQMEGLIERPVGWAT